MPPAAEDERGAGGKIFTRRVPARSSAYTPYARLPPLTASRPTSPKWFSSLVSGAGKLISSVFRSDSDEGSESSSGEEEDMNVSADEELNQRTNGAKPLGNEIYGNRAIVLKSETKSVIEQLIMRETFSRDEYNELTRIIQSRVIDSPKNYDNEKQGNSANRFSYNANTFTGSWRSLDRLNRFPERSPYYSSNFGSPSHGSPFQQWTPELRDKAIMEAMKYLKEKKSETSSRYDTDCGPCNLNTNVLHPGESENDSPVVVAKSYMDSLPPWHSPLWTSTGFKTPSPGTLQLYGDEITNRLPSTKILRRDHLTIGPYNEAYERRNVHLKSTDEAALTGQRNAQAEAINSILEPESVQEAIAVGEKISNISSASQIATSLEHGGDHLILKNTVASEDMNSMKQSHHGVRNADSSTPFVNRGILESELPNHGCEQHLDETIARDDDRFRNDGNDSANKIIENGEESEGSLEANIVNVNPEAVCQINSVTEETQNVASKRSMEHVLETPSMPNPGRKKVLRTRRGRGNLR